MTAPLDVAVNLLWCVPGQVGGSEEYLVRQLLGLQAQRADIEPTLYCLDSFALAHPELVDLHRTVVAPIDGVGRPRRVLAEHTWLAQHTRSAALVHHGGGTAPQRGGGPIVLTVHDLQYATFPEYLGRKKLAYLRWAMPRSVRRADVVAVPTGYVRSTVIDRFDVDPARVVVVPHGVESGLGSDAPSEVELRDGYELGSGPVVVYPAITHPHKGHRFLLDVMNRHWKDPDLRLVLLGGAGAADADVATAIVDLGLAGRVIRPGRVPASHRDGLIALADALVFPSEYEGFGAPIVEAMALGTPVVGSDQAAVAEVIGDAGLALPLEDDAWAGVLDHVRRHESVMRAAGIERAAQFTAARSGAALADAYRLAAAVEPRRPLDS